MLRYTRLLVGWLQMNEKSLAVFDNFNNRPNHTLKPVSPQKVTCEAPLLTLQYL